MKSLLGLSWAGALAALGVATCCVMPMALMLVGLGGSWIAIFGRIAAFSYGVLAVASLCVLAAWAVTLRRGDAGRLRLWLAGSTAITFTAWVIVANEARINDYILTLM